MTEANQARTQTEPAPRVPGNFLAALGLAGGFMAFVAWDQSHWWERKEDYSFGWLVPLFTAYMVYDRWSQITARVREAAVARAGPRWVRWTLNGAAGFGLALGALFFLLGAFYRAGAGASQPGTFALTLGMVGIVLPLIFFNAGGGDGAGAAGRETGPPGDINYRGEGTLVPNPARRDQPSPSLWPTSAGLPGEGIAGLWRERRFRVAVLFLFPVLVWLISAPLVSAVESQISLFLLRKVVTVVAFSFDLLGYPLEQQGNVLMLPKGPVGVADACSGIRSLTACLFAGSFLGAAFFTEFWKKAVLVGASMFFAFLMNLGRSLFLTGWAYAHGPDAISGTVHDAAGYAVLGLTCAGLLVLVPVLNLRLERAEAGT